MPGKKGAYAKDNAVFAVQCNQVGYNGHSTHSGGAYVVGPDGGIVVKADPSLDDLMITAELDADLLSEARRRNAIMRQRRPEMYGELTENV